MSMTRRSEEPDRDEDIRLWRIGGESVNSLRLVMGMTQGIADMAPQRGNFSTDANL
jgi:hypothetical protein